MGADGDGLAVGTEDDLTVNGLAVGSVCSDGDGLTVVARGGFRLLQIGGRRSEKIRNLQAEPKFQVVGQLIVTLWGGRGD